MQVRPLFTLRYVGQLMEAAGLQNLARKRFDSFDRCHERIANVGDGLCLQNIVNASSILVPFSIGVEANLVEAPD